MEQRSMQWLRGPFRALETERRVKLVEKANSEGGNKKKKARYRESRGLRHCQNVECEAILLLDRSVAVYIANEIQMGPLGSLVPRSICSLFNGRCFLNVGRI